MFAACHIVKNYLAHILTIKIPLILGSALLFVSLCVIGI